MTCLAGESSASRINTQSARLGHALSIADYFSGNMMAFQQYKSTAEDAKAMKITYKPCRRRAGITLMMAASSEIRHRERIWRRIYAPPATTSSAKKCFCRLFLAVLLMRTTTAAIIVNHFLRFRGQYAREFILVHVAGARYRSDRECRMGPARLRLQL